MLSLVDMIWTKTKIAFDVKDPLKPTGQDFALPDDWSDLSPAEKRRLTICNLFANQQQSIEVQKQSVERQKTAIRMVRLIVGAIVLVALSLVLVLPPFSCAIGRLLRR